MPLINIRKPKKSRFFADPVFTAITESTVTLPDNWNTLNSKIGNKTVPKAKKQKQEKGSNYNDKMNSKIAAKTTKNKKRSKQKQSS